MGVQAVVTAQRVDVIVDGKTRNTNQLASSPALLRRIAAFIRTAERVEIVRHKIAAGSTRPDGRSGGAVTPPPAAVHPYESLIFCAQEPLLVYRAPLRYAAVVSADHAYRAQTITAIPVLQAQGRRVLAWSDCRPAPEGTPASEAVRMAADYGLDGWVGQGESAAEFDHAYGAGARAIVGNLSALNSEQKDIIRHREVVFLQEVYKNEDAGLIPNFENLPVLVCVGLYPGANGYVPLAWYRQAGFFPPGASIYYSAGISEHDWAEL
jgi:hypothetical protein